MLEAAGNSAAVLAYHALLAGLDEDAFHLSMHAGRESLRILGLNEAIFHFENALRFVKESSKQEMPADTMLRDLYTQLGEAYKLIGQDAKALQMDSEKDRLS